MDSLEYIHQQFELGIKTRMESKALLAEPIARAATLIVQRLLEGSKTLACGNGVSAAEAQRFSAIMLNRFERERPGLPALSLSADVATVTAIANDYDYDEVFAKQIHAIGHPGDLLLAISPGGEAENINAAVAAAHEREMFVIALTGNGGGNLAHHLRETDIEIRVPAVQAAVIQEIHVFAIHCLCDLIDQQLLGTE